MTTYAFKPDYAVPPGATLRDVLEERSISQASLALRMELTRKTVNQIISGAAPITYETSAKLEMVLGIPASFWNKREATYRQSLLAEEEKIRLEEATEWLKEVPAAELASRGLVEHSGDKGELVQRTLRFFGVSSIAAWTDVWLKPQVQFRGSKSHDKRPGYVAAWIRLGELAAEDVDCREYNSDQFREAVKQIRSFTTRPVGEAIKEAKRLCAEAGVVLVVVKEIPKASVSGAARWISPTKAIVMLSLKYKTDDQFWFSFFHEAAHILLHGKKKVFVDDGMSEDTTEEREANQFARDLLIPPEFADRLPVLRSKISIRRFASEIGTSPGIVVGRLQKEKWLPPQNCNDLKVKYKWK